MYGGRDIRRGAQRSTRNFGRGGERRGRGGKRDSGFSREGAEAKDSWD